MGKNGLKKFVVFSGTMPEYSNVADDPAPDFLLSIPAMSKRLNQIVKRKVGDVRRFPTPKPTIDECVSTPALRYEGTRSVLRGSNSYISTWLAASIPDVRYTNFFSTIQI
jgi:hypothetical protein